MSSEYNGNILYVKDENGEWIPIPSIVGPEGKDGKDGVDGQPGPAGPQGPQGEPGTTEWTGIEDKPFESIGSGLSVDSEGNLNAEGGEVPYLPITNSNMAIHVGDASVFPPIASNLTLGVDRLTSYYLTGQSNIDIESALSPYGTSGGRNIIQGSCNFISGEDCGVYSNVGLVMGKGLSTFGISSLRGTIVIGEYNDTANISDKRFIIGNGTSASARSNALTVDINGNIVCNNIPAPPSTDGTYTLQCVVTNGVPTYSWV